VDHGRLDHRESPQHAPARLIPLSHRFFSQAYHGGYELRNINLPTVRQPTDRGAKAARSHPFEEKGNGQLAILKSQD
jgi:hypothetical protein